MFLEVREKIFSLTGSEDEKLFEKFSLWAGKLVRENRVFNLTGLENEGEIFEELFVDSLMLLSEIDSYVSGLEAGNPEIVDIGSGNGAPGLAIAIARPAYRLALLEPVRKKARFLNEMVLELELENVSVFCERAEEHALTRREFYDVAVARAVGELPLLYEYALPLLKKGGRGIFPKGELEEGTSAGSNAHERVQTSLEASGKALSELQRGDRALEILGGKRILIARYMLEKNNKPGRKYRTKVVIEKIFATDRKYPRRPGIAAKRPVA